MELKELQKQWHLFGKRDPLWAIITWEDKKGNKWDPDEFFETGKQEIADVMRYIDKLGVLQRHGRALDFGCGVGRLTQALATYFDEAVGIDIAPSMVKLARRYNRFKARCTYYVNREADLRLFPDQQFDFIYTNIVLQHMKPEYAKSYIREFLRVLTPRGVLVFQLPSRRLTTQGDVDAVRHSPPVDESVGGAKGWIKRHVPELFWGWYVDRKYDLVMEVYGIARPEVEEFLKDNGARIVDVVEDGFAGASWEGFRYCVTKR